MLTNFKLIANVFIGCALLSACSEYKINIDGVAYINGRIDKATFAYLKNNADEIHTLSIRSPGGDAYYAVQMGQLVKHNKWGLIIRDKCMSACAEYIMIANPKVIMKNEPVIGYHRNIHMSYEIMRKDGMTEPERCPSTFIYNSTKRLYEQNNLSHGFWKKQRDLLGIGKAKYEFYNGCTYLLIDTANKWWFPNSRQLTDSLGLEINGQICSDSEKCTSERILKDRYNGKCVVEEKLVSC